MNNETWYTLQNHVYHYYKKYVKGNENTSHELAERKLNRNIRLAKPILRGKIQSIYSYGCLMIKTKSDEKGDRIIAVYNNKYPDKNWELHNKKFKKLNKKFDIPMEVS